MKKTILLLVAAFGFVSMAAAQDLIVKKDATQVEAKVTEITPDAVRYKRFSNPDGPTYVLPVSQIDHIRYINGETERFAPATAVVPLTPLTPATPAAESEGSVAVVEHSVPQVKYVVKTYEIGDIYDQDGLKGIVCVLDETKQQGLLLSLDEAVLNWSVFRKNEYKQVGTIDRKDGQVNMQTLAAYIADNDLSWEDFPAFKWCRDKGEGWYLPSIDELLNVGHNYNGGTRVSNDRHARNKFNNNLKANAGKRMNRLAPYFSSTEVDEKHAYATHMNTEPPYIYEDVTKSGITFYVRAMHRF